MLIPVKLTPSEERLVSFYTKIPVKKLPTVYIADSDIYDKPAFIANDCGMIFHDNGNLFIHISGATSEDRWILTTIAIVSAEDTTPLPIYRRFIDDKIGLFHSHREILRYKERYEKEFRDKILNAVNLNLTSMKDHLKKLSKLKIPMEVVDYPNGKYIKFTFKNVKVGNDMEGYIHYKQIDLVLDPFTFSIKDSRFTFKNFSVKSSEYLPINFHPHIASGICFGNMKEEYNRYISNGYYEFALALIKESVYNYNAESPYVNIITLAKTIKSCERLWKIEKTQAENFRLTHHNCAGCGHSAPIAEDGGTDCTSPNCRGNANAHIVCTLCGNQMTAVQPLTRDLVHSWAYQFRCDCVVTCTYCGTVHTRNADCTGQHCIYNRNAEIKCWHRTRRRKVGGAICNTTMITLREKTSTGAYIWYCPVHDTKVLKAKIALPEFNAFSDEVRRRFRNNNINIS